jgi:hypothetical protein
VYYYLYVAVLLHHMVYVGHPALKSPKGVLQSPKEELLDLKEYHDIMTNYFHSNGRTVTKGI